jgi:pimeloyl-ACP methyl ester carboxylesterase
VYDLYPEKDRIMLSKVVCTLLLGSSLLGVGAQTAPSTNRPSGSYLDVGGTKLYYEECGAGTAVVLLHDGLIHSVTWDEIWAPLCARYHVIRYDRRGYGRSVAAKEPFAPEEDLYAILRRTRSDHAVIVGSSSGGGLALDFALAHPEMVQALFLIGPVVHGMSTSQFFAERGNRNNAPLEHSDLKGAARNWSDDRFLIANGNESARRKLYEALVESPQNLKTGGQFEIRPSPAAVMRLSEIQAPTLVLAGAADIADVHAYCGAIEAALPVVVREVWKDSGHLIQLEHPQELVARFNRFVALALRKEVTVAPATLERYVGLYKLPNSTATVALKGKHLVLAIPGLSDRRLFAASDSEFFLRTTGTELVFKENAAGKITQMVVHNSDGSTISCEKV